MTTTSDETVAPASRRGRPAARTDPRPLSGPDGYVERDGVRSSTRCTGRANRRSLLLPTWSIIHSRFWKAQIPYLARHFRVVTFDGRGNGRSDRPVGAAAYTPDEFAADALAVMDATATERAVVVALSCGALWATILAAEHPERVDSVVYIGPAVGLAPGHPERERHPFDEPLDDRERTGPKYNSHYWQRDYLGFLEFFFAQCFTEPHSSKQIEDCIGWALETDPETLADTTRGIGLACRTESFRDTWPTRFVVFKTRVWRTLGEHRVPGL